MFLQKIKISGFKSFARPITMDFNSSLTGIVGPNGSGKSNIVDAIRWVLGEQSAKSLRGSRMSDVIFAGSEQYRSLNKATVTLYLNNEAEILPVDKKNVTITRKVNKEGESDYLINNQKCRLKDIEELIVDTGLGKDLYSIVGQGEISSIINSKPGNLRELFEENAGIVKHKQRKNEAVKRLANTENDLQRIKDLIWELEKRLPAKEKEADKAEKYKKFKNKLKKLETSLFFDKWEQYEIELAEMRSDRNFMENRIKNKKEKLDSIKTNFQKKKNNLSIKEDKLDNLRDEFINFTNKFEEIKNKINLLMERSRNQKSKKEELNKQKENIVKNRKKQKNRKNDLFNDINKIQIEKNELEKNQNNINQKLEKKQSKLDDLKNELYQIRNNLMNDEKLGEIKSNINKKEEEIKYINQRLYDLVENSKNLILSLKKNIEKREKHNNEIDNLNENKRELHHILKKNKKRKDKLRKKLNDLRDEYEKINNKLNNKSSRLEVLEEMEKEYNGYFRGVKNVLKNKDIFSGIEGVIADLIEVEKKYEKAIETALGSRLQNIVVKEDETARKIVNFLKNKNKGRATFLPLNMITGKEAYTDKIRNISGYIGLGSELISISPNLDQIVKYLLGKTVISSDLKSAVNISKKINNSLKIVSLDGDLINPGGAITGGSSNNSRGLLSRSRQIKELKKEINSLNKILDQKSKKGLTIKNKLENVQNKIEKKKDKLHKLDININNFNKEYKNIKSNIKNKEEQLQEIQKKYFNFINKSEEVNSNIKRLKSQKKSINDSLNKNKKNIKEKEIQIKNLENDCSRYKDNITSVKIKLASTKERLIGLKEKKKELVENINNNKKKIKEINNNLNLINVNIEKTKSDIIEAKQQKIKFKEKKDQVKKKIEALEDLIETKKNKINKIEEKIDNHQNDLDNYRDNFHKLDLQINKLENEQIQIRKKLIDKYKINPEKDVINNKIEINDYSRVEKEIKNFKKNIDQLGEVNQGAIKEFKELKERIDFLKNQKQDLNNAKKSINKIINEIEEKMGNLFIEAFDRVKKEFENIFKKLFSGGKAELVLTDPNNYLETGVKIKAQPPGKKLRKLSLLSGGERALTAIALVFAFLKVNPSPVYILDEIDAPLDDANIVRFSKFIERFSEIAQFIIITHRKHMMTKAETLYGISMEESGVSKLISLNLKDEVVN
ncbi:MAG: chromosome segregation protein SMC [Halanaerobiaceae bacterium]